MLVFQVHSHLNKSAFQALNFLCKLGTLLACMILKNHQYSNALADLYRNRGVLSEGLVLGNLGLWQSELAISVRPLSREEGK